MELYNLQKRFLKGRLSLPITITICIIIWLTCYFVNIYDSHNTIALLPGLEFSFENKNLGILVNQVIAFVGYCLISYLLVVFNNVFNIISKRATIQSSIFFLVISAIPQIHFIHAGIVATLCILIASYFFFQTYKIPSAPVNYFYIGVCWGVAFLIIPKIILIYPLTLISAISFGSLNFRSLCASILGILLPIWFLFSYTFLTDQLDVFYIPFIELSKWDIINGYTTITLYKSVTLVFITLLIVMSTVSMLLYRPKMRVKTFHILNYFLLLSIAGVILIALNPTSYYNYAPLCIAGISFVVSNTLMAYQTKVSNLLFIVALILLLIVLFINTWIPLYNF